MQWQVHPFATLLPRETITRLVTFSPPTDGNHRPTLRCKSLVGRNFELPLNAECSKPSLRLSHNLVTTAATMQNDFTSTSIVMTNTTKVRRLLRLSGPSRAGKTLLVKLKPCFAP